MYPEMIDMHAHLSAYGQAEVDSRIKQKIYTFFSAGCPAEAEALLALRQEGFAMTAGVHPWNTDQISLAAMRPYMEQACFIGEIGMDDVWCDVDLRVQRRAFAAQLDYAAQAQKPIVLHTKNQERAILEMVRDFPEPILVHWYSGDRDTLEEYAALGCYFTIGPDMALAVDAIPADRLFVETDGLESLPWARRQRVKASRAAGAEPLDPEKDPELFREALPEEIGPVLRTGIAWAARQKGLPADTFTAQLLENARAFAASSQLLENARVFTGDSV